MMMQVLPELLRTSIEDKGGSVHTLYVNPNNPEHFRTKVSGYLPFVIVIGLFMLMILGIIFL